MAAVVDGVSGDTVNGWTDQCHQALLERPAVPDRPETRDDVCGRRTQNVWHGLLISWRQRRVSVWDERRPYQLVPHTDRRPPPVSWHCSIPVHSFIHTLPGTVRFHSRRLPSCDTEGASTRLRQWEREEPSLRKYGTDVAAAAAYLAGDKPGWMRWERRWWKRREMTVGCGQCWTGGGPCCIYSSVFTTAEHSKHWLLSGLLTASTVQEIDLIFSLYFCTVLG